MAQSLENKFKSGGSVLGYPNNPTQPIPTGVVSVHDRLSSLHDLYSYDGAPPASDVSPIFPNTRLEGVTQLPEPTQLQAFTGPQNTGAAAAGFETYNNQQTYDDFILNQGSQDGGPAASRFEGRGEAFIR